MKINNNFHNYNPQSQTRNQILSSRMIKTYYPVFITAHVLSKGIEEILCTIIERSDKKIHINTSDGRVYFGDDFHMRIEEAIVDAEKRRLEEIESINRRILALQKKAIKLEILKFD